MEMLRAIRWDLLKKALLARASLDLYRSAETELEWNFAWVENRILPERVKTRIDEMIGKFDSKLPMTTRLIQRAVDRTIHAIPNNPPSV